MLLLGSCKEPLKKQDFKEFYQLKGWESKDVVTLHLDIRDTLNPKTVFIMGQLFNNQNIEDKKYIYLNVIITSPDSTSISDRIKLPLQVKPDGKNANKIGRIVEYQWPFMKDVLFSRKGVWSFEFSQVSYYEHFNRELCRHLYGIGIKYE